MTNIPGVISARKKDGTVYYRASITIHSKHISLGSFSSAEAAGKAYHEASAVFRKNRYLLEDYTDSFALSFSKFVMLVNYRDNGIYFKTPIYLHPHFFYYYLSPEQYLIFDREDLFFYATHKIQTRGNYLFICDYGSQYSILTRYGIKSYAKKGEDYLFVNHNEYDLRYENIKVINEYMGVTQITKNNQMFFECIIHVNGNVLVGRYPKKELAAIAYNKAADTLSSLGMQKKYIKNYISCYTSEQYHALYKQITISERLLHYCEAKISSKQDI